MLTAKIIEGLLYQEVSVLDLPYMIYDDTWNYIIAVPALLLMQYFMLGSTFKLFMPLSFLGLWTQKYHMKIWQMIDYQRADHFYIWTITICIFVTLSAKNMVYPRLQAITDFKGKAQTKTKTDT